jgi:hypothetical protein
MRDDEIVALLTRHQRSVQRAPGCTLVDRAALRLEVGDEHIAEVDAWVERRGGTIEHAALATSLLERARARMRGHAVDSPALDQYELPRTLLAPGEVP